MKLAATGGTVLIGALCAGAVMRVDAAVLPSGFAEDIISGPISSGTAMEFSPDGKLYILEQAGTMQVYQGTGSMWTQVATSGNFFNAAPLTINAAGERGLLGIAFDPNYNNNHFLYVYYTSPTPAIHNRISRFTADATGTQVVPDSEAVIMDLDNLAAQIHNGGAIHFGPDGKLYVAVGENGNGSNAQNPNNRLGKILRLNPDPLDPIPADNPATIAGLGATSGANRAIWCAGLRNPFTFAFKPGTSPGNPGLMHINDVGEGTWEEINIGAAGANYGWNITEGMFTQASFPNFTNPIVAYHHSNPALSVPTPGYTGAAITGGAFYAPASPTFPAGYVNGYFFADYVSSWIRRYDALSNAVSDFATSAGNPVDLHVTNDGTLFYLARSYDASGGRVFRVRFGDCIGDVNHNGTVDIDDLVFVITHWNASGGPGDVNGSGLVDIDDLVAVITHWGPCPGGFGHHGDG